MSETTEQKEAAEVGGSRLERLVMRFEAMAKAREDHAAALRSIRDGEQFTSICGLESAALAYRRCADEVKRVANGEEPAEPGYRWD